MYRQVRQRWTPFVKNDGFSKEAEEDLKGRLFKNKSTKVSAPLNYG